jgi:hypothetical protein
VKSGIALRGAATAGWLLALLLVAGAAPAQPREVALPEPSAETWRALEFPRIEKHTRYERVQDGGRPVLRAVSECSASALLTPLDGIDLAQTPLLRWRWKVSAPLAVDASEREKAGDDFAARVYVAFAFESERASLFERARHAIGVSLYGEEMPGLALDYVWSRAEPAGAHWENPYTASSLMLSLGPAPAGIWRDAEADILADYQRFIGGRPPRALFVALMSDSDDSCSRAEASYADFRLAERKADPAR